MIWLFFMVSGILSIGWMLAMSDALPLLVVSAISVIAAAKSIGLLSRYPRAGGRSQYSSQHSLAEMREMMELQTELAEAEESAQFFSELDLDDMAGKARHDIQRLSQRIAALGERY